MTKFKVGDKVRIVQCEYDPNGTYEKYLGRIDIIRYIRNDSDEYPYMLTNVPYAWKERELELVEKKPTHKIDCSLTVNYAKEKKRMCKYFQSGHNCANCPLGSFHNGFDIVCGMMVEEKPTEAIAIVQKWSDEHPVKTIKDDFLEKYPNAEYSQYGLTVCAKCLGYFNKDYSCPNDGDCNRCWNTPLSEVKK